MHVVVASLLQDDLSFYCYISTLLLWTLYSCHACSLMYRKLILHTLVELFTGLPLNMQLFTASSLNFWFPPLPTAKKNKPYIASLFLYSLRITTTLHCAVLISANKKAKLINGTLSGQHQTGNSISSSSVSTTSSSSSSSASSVSSTNAFDDSQTYTPFERPNSRPGGPNLVNKQLVLPFVPPSFPNGSSDGSNHLIKPSEYLKSISDKRSSVCSSSGR